MATIDNKKMIDEIIANNGHYYDDPQVYAIFEYTNGWGNTTWALIWHKEHMSRYAENPPYVNNPKVLWCKDGHEQG